MKNIFKKIGFLCTALLALSLGTSVNKVEAATQTVTYTIATVSSVTTSGIAPTGSKAEFKSTYTNKEQLTSGNTATLKLSGYANCKINSFTLSMKSNASKGQGSLSVTVGNTTIYSISDSKFNTSNWYGSWSTSYVSINKTVTNAPVIGTGEDLIFEISATQNSLYIKSYTINYTVVESEEPSVPETPVDTTDKVKDLFIEYNNGGTYIKETKLNVNSATMKEVAKYFHNKQDVRYRKTEYKPGELTMVTKESENADWDSNTSTYKDNGTGVDHLTNGVKDYSTSGIVNGENRNSVEDWFVTLNDFINSTSTGWTGNENDGYTYNLTATTATEEHEMTRLAREFVAPMWLAPNAENYNYVEFTSLTVQEVSNTLVLKLYVSETNSGELLDGSALVFAEATIKLPVPDVFNFDFSNITSKGSEITSATALETFQEYLGQYKSILTSVETNKVYAGNGSGGAYEYTPGLLKFGTSSATGSLKLIFDESTAFTTVEIVCRSWSTSEGTDFTVNGTTKAAPKTDKGTLVFTIAESNEISISTAKRGFIFSIKLS